MAQLRLQAQRMDQRTRLRVTPSSRSSHKGNRPRRGSLLALGAALLLCLPAIFAQKPQQKDPIVPTIPKENRHQPGKVFLEHADMLELDELRSADFQVLRGNVVFRKDDMFMYCDSAYFYEESNSLDAFSNVRMEQGDTLFVYGDELNYNGMDNLARLFALPGRKVRLINRDVKLTTDQFEYDLEQNVGYYRFGGVLTDKDNQLTSVEGYYHPDTKDAYFYDDVVLMGPRENDTLWMYTDSLLYNTQTGIATLLCSTRIVNKDGEIHSTSGFYDTKTEQADLLARSLVVTKRGNTLIGDTLFYDRKLGFGEAFGNMILTDSVRQSTLMGEYGFYNELTDSSFVTGNALAMEYSRKDTLYVHADTIISRQLADSTHLMTSFHNVRFYRNDIQGICDSLVFAEVDSTLLMHHHPVLWNGVRQIHGNTIMVHLNDSTADWARLPDFGMTTEHIAEDCYDQLAGSDMTVWLADTTITRLYVEGNVQLIMFPMEQDSTYNKFTYVESTYLDAHFADNNIERVIMWPETTGNVTPLYLARKTEMFLPTFQWYEALRPLAPDEVFDMPEQMVTLMSMPPVGGKRRPAEGPVRGPAVPKLPPHEAAALQSQAIQQAEPEPGFEPEDDDTAPADNVAQAEADPVSEPIPAQEAE